MKRDDALRALAARDDRFCDAVRALVADGDAEAVRALRDAAKKDDDDFDRRALLELALFALPDRDAMVESVQLGLRSIYPTTTPAIDGLILRDEPAAVPFGDNPFHVTPAMRLDEAVDAAWAPARARAPTFVALLKERLLGLALARGRGWKDPLLVYLFLWKRRDTLAARPAWSSSPPAPPPTARRDLAAWCAHAMLGAFVGSPPVQAPPGSPIALGELWSVHGDLRDGLVWLEGPPTHTLADLWKGMPKPLAAFPARNGGRLPSQFLDLWSYGDDRIAVMDTEKRDDRGDPMMREWTGEQFELGDHAAPFWAWFEQTMPVQLLHED